MILYPEETADWKSNVGCLKAKGKTALSLWCQHWADKQFPASFFSPIEAPQSPPLLQTATPHTFCSLQPWQASVPTPTKGERKKQVSLNQTERAPPSLLLWQLAWKSKDENSICDDKGAPRPLVVEKETHMTCFLAFPEPSPGPSKQNSERRFYL